MQKDAEAAFVMAQRGGDDTVATTLDHAYQLSGSKYKRLAITSELRRAKQLEGTAYYNLDQSAGKAMEYFQQAAEAYMTANRPEEARNSYSHAADQALLMHDGAKEKQFRSLADKLADQSD